MDNKTQGKLLEGRAYIWMIPESNRDKKHSGCDAPDLEDNLSDVEST